MIIILYLEAQQSLGGNETEIVIPLIDHTSLIMNHLTTKIEFDKYVQSNFSEIDNRLHEIKNNLKLPDIHPPNFHDAHHYSVTYALVISLVVCFVIIWRKFGAIQAPAVRAILPNVLADRRITMPTIFVRENVATAT